MVLDRVDWCTERAAATEFTGTLACTGILFYVGRWNSRSINQIQGIREFREFGNSGNLGIKIEFLCIRIIPGELVPQVLNYTL